MEIGRATQIFNMGPLSVQISAEWREPDGESVAYACVLQSGGVPLENTPLTLECFPEFSETKKTDKEGKVNFCAPVASSGYTLLMADSRLRLVKLMPPPVVRKAPQGPDGLKEGAALNEAEGWLEQNDYGRAICVLSSALGDNPESIRIYERLAAAYLAARMPRDGIRVADTGLRLAAKKRTPSADLLRLRATFLHLRALRGGGRKFFLRALRDVNSALRLAPQEERSWVMKLTIFWRLGWESKAIGAYESYCSTAGGKSPRMDSVLIHLLTCFKRRRLAKLVLTGLAHSLGSRHDREMLSVELEALGLREDAEFVRRRNLDSR